MFARKIFEKAETLDEVPTRRVKLNFTASGHPPGKLRSINLFFRGKNINHDG
jgi:hypothetical protein